MTDLRRELCRVVREIHSCGWCQGTGGNFSVRVKEQPLELLITRSGTDKRRVTPEDLLVVGRDGAAVSGETGKPSAESLLHVTVASLTDAAAVLHTHSVWGTLLGEHFLARGGLAITGYEMMKGLAGIRTHEAEVFVPIVENSQDMPLLAEKITEMAAEWPGMHGFLVAGHGLYAWGATLEQAHRHVEIFEFLFECVGRRTPFQEFTG